MIARKMLIYSTNVVDLIFGTIAIAIVFFTMKFLVGSDGESMLKNDRADELSSLMHLKESHIVFGKGRSIIEAILNNRISFVIGEDKKISLCTVWRGYTSLDRFLMGGTI